MFPKSIDELENCAGVVKEPRNILQFKARNISLESSRFFFCCPIANRREKDLRDDQNESWMSQTDLIVDIIRELHYLADPDDDFRVNSNEKNLEWTSRRKSEMRN